MTKVIYETTRRGITLVDQTTAGHFTMVPNYVIDLWTPIIGIKALGLYTLYLRLAKREEGTERKSAFYPLKELATRCRVSDKTITALNQLLQLHKFIKIEKPTEKQRREDHWSTKIYLLDPPQEVPIKIAAERTNKRGEVVYKPVPWWLHKRTSDTR